MIAHLGKKIFIYAILIMLTGMYFACQKNADYDEMPAAHVQFLTKYKPLLGNPEKKPLDYYSIPKNIVKLQSKSEKIAVIDYKAYPFVQCELMGMPQVAGFFELDYVFKDGTMFFSDERAPDRDQIPIERGDKPSHSFYFSDNKLEKVTSYKGDMAFSASVDKVLVNGMLRDFYFDKLDGRYNYYEDKRTVALTDSRSFPEPFAHPFLLGPILSKRAIGYTVYNWGDINNKVHSDKVIISYQWQEKKAEKLFILPASDAYKPFHSFHGYIRSLDTKNRLYLRLKADFQFNYQGLKDGHLMIYDPAKDTIYNIFFTLFDAENEGEKLFDTHYVLGADELIYCQLVTDKAYYIYKIDPQWHIPGESMDYDPIFFKFYPELRAEWDKT